MEKDEIFETAERYVKTTGRSVFLTGKAGTGKTTFLKYITQTTTKRYIVLAPTGVAAINAGGSTIHSFFQLPLCPYLPDIKELVTEYQMPERYRSLRKERVKIIRTLDLLIIDEISMVRADLLDAVDMTLKRYRRNDKPFGGIQLLMIGDAQQLSPVVKDTEREHLSRVYPSPYFFHSKALQKLPYITIELQKVYRQKDRNFLEILNAVRENRVTQEILIKLNGRVRKGGSSDEGEEAIRLTTHNAQADSVNAKKLEELPGEGTTFGAEINGEFPENSYPADEILTLKKGAQVMFIRNDPENGFYNGKLGKVEYIGSDGTVMVTDAEGQTINVVPAEWENIQYSLDEQSGEIRQEIVGTFRQLPIRIAWAITIHKSQGLTFDKVCIDAGAAFAFGQVYVALSRCRRLEGITLDSPIRMSGIYSDEHVAGFNAEIPSTESVRKGLEAEEQHYRFDTLREIFSFDDTCRTMRWLLKVWREKIQDIYSSEYQGLMERQRKAEEAKKVGDAFKVQLTKIEAARMPDDEHLNTRLLKASEYFRPTFEDIRSYCIKVYSLEIDNKETAKRAKEAGDELLTLLEITCRTLEVISVRGFSIEEYCRIKTECMLEDRSRSKAKRLRKLERSEGEAGTVNGQLREKLHEWRKEKFMKENIPAYTIMHQSTLMDIASYIPKTKEELLGIKGFGDAKFKKYGEEILEICRKF